MKSGGPWNLRGLRPERRAAARMPHAGRACPRASGLILSSSRQKRRMTRPGGQTTPKNGPPIVPCDGAEKNFAIAKRGANEEPPASARICVGRTAPQSSQDDNDRMIEQDRDRMPRHRDREPDERQWRARTGESEQHSRHRNRKYRFRDREADEFRSRSSFRLATRRTNVIAIAANDRANGRRRRTRMASARPGSRVPTPRALPPRRYRDRGFDDDQRLNSPPDDLQRRWEAGAAWRAPAREEQPHRDEQPGWIGSASTMLRSKSKSAALNSKSKGVVC